jgi:hypothetical protein
MLVRLLRTVITALAVLTTSVSCQDESTAGDNVVGADADADAAAWQPHRQTKVLYAGWPDGSREQAFRAFLQRHFDTVGVIGLKNLSRATAAGYDVVVADWGSHYGNDGYPKEAGRSMPQVSLPTDFDAPVIAMDYVSTVLRSRRKLDWL